ncbi:hypothetical protein V5E97_09925 [Singulisphaera sp. Ch08]|uniref:Uncharacterized protein n=1 Tax=Singulisphaera sp. Ch08 TaxID=3120278 RepID=A0AAU7CN43_9BACT
MPLNRNGLEPADLSAPALAPATEPPLPTEVYDRLVRIVDRCLGEFGMNPTEVSDLAVRSAVDCGFASDDPEIERYRKVAVDLAWQRRSGKPASS